MRVHNAIWLHFYPCMSDDDWEGLLYKIIRLWMDVEAQLSRAYP
jgi:hypothetical protein